MAERSQKLNYFKENNIIDSAPLLKDLYEHITPQYAADWKVIGVLLDLPASEIKAIEAGNPTNTKWCCNSMLNNWLEIDTSATWRKMLCAIESPAVSSTYNSDYLDEIYQTLDSSQANKVPLLKELYQHITPRYAADWKVIGTLLGMPSGELKAIAAGNPTNVKWCCNTMLERWLDVDRTATWKKVLVAIKSPALSSTCNNDFIYKEAVALLLGCLERTYFATRFSTDKNTWPPQQSKHFTTLAFIYHKNERTQREVITIAKASQSGHIDDIMQATGDSNSSSEDYELEDSRATKDISELLAPLDHNDGCQSQTILIEGAPGIGKSFLLKHIAFLWATKQVLTSSKLLFLLCLRDPAVQKMSSVNDLVNYFCKHEKAASNLGHICAEHLYKTGGKDVTILLDGLDEFPEELHDNSFIVYILEHRVLPACNVIVSSRPHASAHLHNSVIMRVDILGFTEEDRECFIKQSLSGRPEKVKILLAYLQNHPTINSLCFVPFIMTLLVFLYNHDVVLFDSSSELYRHFVCLTIQRHLTKLGLAARRDICDLNKLPACWVHLLE